MATDFGFIPYAGDEPFVFISYKTEECAAAAKFALYLHENGVNVFYDNALEPGENWAKRLLETIEKRSCRGVILMVSAKSLRSQPVIDEVKTAHYARKTVLGVYIENVTADVQPMKSFLADTHSVAAWKLDDSTACQQVLTGALNMLEGDRTPPEREGKADKHWQTAELFMRNSIRSGKESDVSAARKELEAMTASAPMDYRGWLGLSMCECLLPIESLDDADIRLDRAADYYSYVVSSGADSAASSQYTEAKTRMWDNILRVMRREKDSCDNLEGLEQLASRAEHFRSHLGHTENYIGEELERFISGLPEKTEEIRQRMQTDALTAACEWEILSDAAVRLKKYNGSGSEYVIPSEVDGRKVTSVGSEAFRGCDGIVSVTLPDGVTEIGANAFAGCKGLTSVNIPDSVAAIGKRAFYGCRSLTSVVIPEGAELIGRRAFGKCRKLTVSGIGGYFSRAAKAARRSRVKYLRIKEPKSSNA